MEFDVFVDQGFASPDSSEGDVKSGVETLACGSLEVLEIPFSLLLWGAPVDPFVTVLER
jgi:hypothetical protein